MGYEYFYAITVGANIGTAILGFVLALSQQNNTALQLSLADMFFNLFGGFLWYFPLIWLRRFPLLSAKAIGIEIGSHRVYAFIYILFLFFFYPWVMFSFSSINRPTLIGAGIAFTLLCLFLFWFLWIRRYRWWWLPQRIQPMKLSPEPVAH